MAIAGKGVKGKEVLHVVVFNFERGLSFRGLNFWGPNFRGLNFRGLSFRDTHARVYLKEPTVIYGFYLLAARLHELKSKLERLDYFHLFNS